MLCSLGALTREPGPDSGLESGSQSTWERWSESGFESRISLCKRYQSGSGSGSEYPCKWVLCLTLQTYQNQCTIIISTHLAPTNFALMDSLQLSVKSLGEPPSTASESLLSSTPSTSNSWSVCKLRCTLRRTSCCCISCRPPTCDMGTWSN